MMKVAIGIIVIGVLQNDFNSQVMWHYLVSLLELKRFLLLAFPISPV